MKRMNPIILMLTIPAILLAGPRNKMEKPRHPGMEMKMIEQLDLSDEQAAEIHDMRIAHQKEIVPLKADLKLAQIELDELIQTGDPSKKLDAAIKKVNTLEGKLNELQIRHRVAVNNVLTDEQRAMMLKMHHGCGMDPEKTGHYSGKCKKGAFGPPPPPEEKSPMESQE